MHICYTTLLGQGEADQINKIFKVLGAPTEARWPDYKTLPNASKLSWKLPNKNRLGDLFPKTAFAGGIPLSDIGLDLMNSLLTLDPKQVQSPITVKAAVIYFCAVDIDFPFMNCFLKRVSADEALKHQWLTAELPRPTQPDLMPVFKSRHE